MNVNLKKISIVNPNAAVQKSSVVKPNADIKVGMKTIIRDITGVIHSPTIRNAYTLTQAAYTALVESGEVEADALYFIVEE